MSDFKTFKEGIIACVQGALVNDDAVIFTIKIGHGADATVLNKTLHKKMNVEGIVHRLIDAAYMMGIMPVVIDIIARRRPTTQVEPTVRQPAEMTA